MRSREARGSRLVGPRHPVRGRGPGRPRGGAATAALVAVWALAAAAIAAGPEAIPARGAVAGQQVDTTVDGHLARRLLEAGSAAAGADPELAAAIDRALTELGGTESLRLAAAGVAERTSVDFATLALVEHLYRDPVNRELQDAFAIRRRGAIERGAAIVAAAHRRVLLVFVPGWAWRQDRGTGADFARPRRLLADAGFDVELVETDDLGPVEANAERVASALRGLARRGRPMVVVSTSKGGPEAAIALGGLLTAEESAPVRAWISIGGLLRGTPYADRYREGIRRWMAGLAYRLKGLPPALIDNLSTALRRPAFERLRFPDHLATLQFVGAPLSGHVEGRVRERYEILRAWGPNDGLTLLADELVEGGVALTAVGLDHYYRDPEIDATTLALIGLVLDRVDLGAGPGQR